MMENNYRYGNSEVAARQHNGTDESALALTAWVNTDGGSAEAILKGTYDYDLDNAYIWLIREDVYKPVKFIVGPYCWIVRTSPGQFICMYPDIFAKYYKPLEVIEVPS